MNRVDSSMVTTANELAGYRIVKNYGNRTRNHRQIAQRDRETWALHCKTIIGGNITILTNLCEKTARRCL